jgi:hypothetical protein
MLPACNPVKQVLTHQDKFDKVAEEVIRRGYCVNDTILSVITKDSIITKDVIVEKNVFLNKMDIDTTFSGIRIRIHGDTLSLSGEVRGKTKIINRIEKSYIKDTSYEKILLSDISDMSDSISLLKFDLAVSKQEMKVLASEKKYTNIKYVFSLIALGVIIVLWIITYFKKVVPFKF